MFFKEKTMAKENLIEYLKKKAKTNSDEYEEFDISIDDVSIELLHLVQCVACSLDIAMKYEVKEEGAQKPILLFDKKKYSKKAALLNDSGVVFGFLMDYCKENGDSLRSFRDRLDFALSLYPNHIFFPQLEKDTGVPKPTGTFNTIDAKAARDLAFATSVFYSYGRAVPWFLSVLKALKMNSTAFLADFAEWQRVDNCAFGSFDPATSDHEEIEKMQLVFLRQKFEEKHKEHIFSAVEDIVRLNGAFSRVISDDEERLIETTYNPDDLLSPEAFDLSRFVESSVMQSCQVAIFAGEDGPDYKIL